MTRTPSLFQESQMSKSVHNFKKLNSTTPGPSGGGKNQAKTTEQKGYVYGKVLIDDTHTHTHSLIAMTFSIRSLSVPLIKLLITSTVQKLNFKLDTFGLVQSAPPTCRVCK